MSPAVLMVQPGTDPGCPSETSTVAEEEVISDIHCNLEGDIFEPDEPKTFHAQESPCPSLSPLTSCLTLFHLLCSYAKIVITRYPDGVT